MPLARRQLHAPGGTPGLVLRTAALATMLLPALAHAQAPAAVAGSTGPNRIYFGQDIAVAEGQRIHNAVCVFCSVQIEGDLSGRAVVLFGNATVSGRVEHGLLVVGGNAVVDAQARILGRTAVIAGNAVYESDESLSGDAFVLGGHVSSLAGPHPHDHRRVALTPWVASGLALLGLLLLTPFWFPRRAAPARTTP